MSTDLLPPLLPVTDDDHSAWVITTSTLLLILTILVASVTLISRIRVLRVLSWSDALLSAATVCFFSLQFIRSRIQSNEFFFSLSFYLRPCASISPVHMVLVNIEMRSVTPRFNLIARYELCERDIKKRKKTR